MTKAELVRALAAYPDDAWVYVNLADKRHDQFWPAGVRLAIQGVRPRAVNDSAAPHLGLLVDADNRERAAEAGDARPAYLCPADVPVVAEGRPPPEPVRLEARRLPFLAYFPDELIGHASDR